MFRNFDNQKRSHESPMDWEWQTQGPMDPTSPFVAAQNQSRTGQKGESDMGIPSTRLNALGGFNASQPDKQPITSSFMSTNTSTTSNTAPHFRNPSFTTPRKAFDQDLFSETSGVESSPGDTADGEDTPDPLPQKNSQTMVAFTNGGTARQPIFGKYGAGFMGTTPPAREQRRGKYGNAIVQKMRKRKRMDRDYALARGMQSESESDDDSQPKSRGNKGSSKRELPSKPGWISSFFDYIESHPNLPNVLSYYAQLLVNFFVAALTIFGIYTFWQTIRSDVDKASEAERSLVLAEIAKCAQDYVINSCGQNTRAPALEIPCNEWEHCMHRDPDSVGRAKISAHTFAQIFNSFVEPISWKAMGFVVIIITITLLVNNLAFGHFRNKHAPYSHAPPQAPAQPFFQQHPNQSFHWGDPTLAPRTPRHQMEYESYPALMPNGAAPMRSPSKSEKRRSPSKGDREREWERQRSRSPSKKDRSPSKEYGYGEERY